MKRCVVFLLVVFVASRPGYAQSITISQKNALLKDIFKAIEKQTDYIFFLDRQLLQDAKRVSINVKDVPITEVLDISFQGQPITYSIIDKTIVVKRKEVIPTIAPPANLINITGKITNENGEAVPGATVEIRGTNKLAVANDSGVFHFSGIKASANIIISSINYEPQEITLQGREEVYVRLNRKIGELSDVVIVSSGYQEATKEKTTGSYFKLNTDLINRRVSTNILQRLDGVTPGLVFNKNINIGTNQAEISIRGRSTIYANPNPLIVIDNFPYTGDINNINPNDVESITILKDAAATAIWGVLSGNGVIVITTKTGKYNQPAKVSFNSNITIGTKPDLFYEPKMSSSDYIDVEQFLFANDAFLETENSPLHTVLSPVVEILIKKRDGIISPADADTEINKLRKLEMRNDLENKFYRKSINQQYAVNASGGGNTFKYYMAAGFDRNLHNLVRNEYMRKTFTANTTVALIKDKLELNTGIFISENEMKNNNTGTAYTKYSYTKLVDDKGNALPVYFYLRQPYLDTAGQGKLLDWNLRPLDELQLHDNNIKANDYRVNIGLKYSIIKTLDATLLYQHSRGNMEQSYLASEKSFFARDMINRFSQILPDGTVFNPVPVGGILDQRYASYEANNFRTQFNFNQEWKQLHLLAAIGGFELRNMETKESSSRQYGYKENQQGTTNVDYKTFFPLYYSPVLFERIPNSSLPKTSTDRYLSYYLNLTYTFKKRYIISASGRKDESNLFGVDANKKGVPLWSAGLGWIISRENFYHVNSIPYLKFRITSGYNGNVDKSVSAYTTALIDGQNNYGAPLGSIINPPNPSLRWEKIYMMNIGLDFATKNRLVEGSIEYYLRKGKDIIGNSPLDPTTGNTAFRGNTANMRGHGADILLTLKPLNRKVKWQVNFLFSHAIDKITTYKVQKSSIGEYLDAKIISPLQGHPLYSVYSLAWMGLDPENGDPRGLLDDKISKDYSGIYRSTNFEELKYRGAANPTFFGSIRNTINWQQFECSFNITWKAGYYFRRNSIDYYNLLFLGQEGHPDYIQRWQQSGDEKVTYIPSVKYPVDQARELFYRYSDILIEKADHIRLQDIQLSYAFSKGKIPRLPVQVIQLYLYANNWGILWKANHHSIDPDYITGFPNPRTISVGIKINF